MNSRKAHLVMRGYSSFNCGPYEIWDVGCGHSVCVAYRKIAIGIIETIAFPFDRIEHITGKGMLGRWSGDATGGKAMRELGYEIVEGEHEAN